MSDKEQFLHHLASELDAMERQVDDIMAEVRADHPESADHLREKLDIAKTRTDELKDAADHEWAHHREAAHSAWEDLKKAFSQVRSRLGD